MPRPCTPLPRGTAARIHAHLRRSTSVWEYRRLQCIALRCEGRDANEISKIVGLHPSSVRTIWMIFLRGGCDAILGEKRGRMRGAAHLTLKDEQELLRPLHAAAASGRLTTVRDIHRAVCDKIGKTVDLTVTYRMLARHGWRKVVPLPHHPRGDRSTRDTFRVFFPQDRASGSNGSTARRTPF